MTMIYRICFLFLTLACFVFPNRVTGVTPPPDGGYPNQNTAEGEDALFSLDTNAKYHTAFGYHANYSVVTSSYDTAVGAFALSGQIFHYYPVNTIIGSHAMMFDSGTYGNSGATAVGSNALMNAGSDCQAIGVSAMSARDLDTATPFSTTAAVGSGALAKATSNTYYSVAFGYQAMGESLQSIYNIAVGVSALLNSNDSYNVALGNRALANLTSPGAHNIGIGYQAGLNLGANSSYNIDIGNVGQEGDNNTIRIGTDKIHQVTYLAGVSGATIPHGPGVVINSSGQLGVLTSSARGKEAIKPMGKASDTLYQLRPVTFRYKKDLDPKGRRQFGLVAEEVEKIDPELVAYDKDHRPYSVRYQAISSMLLNEFLKDHAAAAGEDKTLQEQEQKLDEVATKLARIRADVQKQIATIAEAKNRLQTTRVHN
jgi:Chaperone of endosialidase